MGCRYGWSVADEREAVVADVVNASWLPPGGRAQVVRGGGPQVPMCLVRVLLVRGGRAWCVPRDGGGKLDLPTRAVAPGDLDGSQTVRGLVSDVTGSEREARFVGAVRNVVGVTGNGYPWPVPVAHFGVWAVDAEPCIGGVWLSLDDPMSLLRERHWFPLVRSVDALPC